MGSEDLYSSRSILMIFYVSEALELIGVTSSKTWRKPASMSQGIVFNLDSLYNDMDDIPPQNAMILAEGDYL